MKWVIATNQGSLENKREDWPRLIRSAVNSARENTTLDAFMIYDGEDSEFIRELRSIGITVIRHRLTFYNFIAKYQSENRAGDWHHLQIASGAFLRVDAPLLFPKDDFILYTDCDVMFLKDPCLAGMRPAYFACAPERARGDARHINTGVMLINIQRLREDHADFCKFIQDNYSIMEAFDQTAYISYYEGRNDLLSDELNWKPYWGVDGDPAIVHFHGPKPRVALGLLTNERFQTHRLLREIFEENPHAYEEFLWMWTRFQIDCGVSRDAAGAHTLDQTNGRSPDYLDAADSPHFLSVMSKLNERIASTRETIEGNVCYLDQTSPDDLLISLPTMEPNHIKKRRNLGVVARKSTMMLEIGLNGGHSALLTLLANPALTLVAVDNFQHKYAEQAATFLKERFPRRFHYIRGDSRDVLPRMALEKPKLQFDAFHVDGGHAESLAYADISNALRLAGKDALLVLDDLQAPWLARIFDECLLLGHFRPAAAHEFARTVLHEVVLVN
jgi:hypothetical protein